MFKKYANWIFNPNRRYHIFTLLSFGLILLYPFFGWNPILILWIVNAALAYKEHKSSKFRFVHFTIALLLSILVLSNIVMRILEISIVLF